MKSIVSIVLVIAALSLCLFGCSNVPKEPPTTSAVQQSYVSPMGETVAAPENPDNVDGSLPAYQFVETLNKVEIVLSSYYVYKNSVAEITNVHIDDDGFSINADGTVDVKINAIGSKKNDMRIGYEAYDADGNLVRNSYVLAKLDGVKEGDTVEGRRFDLPRNAVKVVFMDYVEPKL